MYIYNFCVYIFRSRYFRFGGGPACTHLYECPICEEKYESLQKRRQYEMELFQRLNHTTDNHTAIYALAMAWLRQWQSFVRGKETQPPGPIDNNSIVVNKTGQNSLKVGKSLFISERDCLKLNYIYQRLLKEMYILCLSFLHSSLYPCLQARIMAKFPRNCGNSS